MTSDRRQPHGHELETRHSRHKSATMRSGRTHGARRQKILAIFLTAGTSRLRRTKERRREHDKGRQGRRSGQSAQPAQVGYDDNMMTSLRRTQTRRSTCDELCRPAGTSRLRQERRDKDKVLRRPMPPSTMTTTAGAETLPSRHKSATMMRHSPTSKSAEALATHSRHQSATTITNVRKNGPGSFLQLTAGTCRLPIESR
jgi:hypothetical protein